MLRHGIPPEIVTALRAVSAGFRAWGSAVEVTRPLGDGGSCACATARCGCCTGPATARRTRSSTTSARAILLAADHLIAHISSNPLLARPLGAERRLRRARARRRWSPTSTRWSRRARWSCRWCCPATAADRRPRRADRRALPPAPPARGEDPPADRRAAAHRARDRARAVGQRRGHAGLPDAVGGARPRRPAARRRHASSKASSTGSCASSPR